MRRRDLPEYSIFSSILQRCNNPKSTCYLRYGGRGIKVAPEWSSFDGFPAFLTYMGPRPSPKHSIERIDNDGHYSPGNVKWALKYEQDRNKSSNVFLTFNGETLCQTDMAAKYGLSVATLIHRLRKGWSVEKSILTPINYTHTGPSRILKGGQRGCQKPNNRGHLNGNAALSQEEAIELRRLRTEGMSYSKLSKHFKIGIGTAYRIVNNQVQYQ